MEKNEDSNNGYMWKILSSAAGVAAVIGLLINVLMNFSDLRSAVRDAQAEIKVLTAKVVSVDLAHKEVFRDVNQKINQLDTTGSRHLVATEVKVVELQKELDVLRDLIGKLNDNLLTHNQEMIQLYHNPKPMASPPHNSLDRKH